MNVRTEDVAFIDLWNIDSGVSNYSVKVVEYNSFKFLVSMARIKI